MKSIKDKVEDISKPLAELVSDKSDTTTSDADDHGGNITSVPDYVLSKNIDDVGIFSEATSPLDKWSPSKDLTGKTSTKVENYVLKKDKALFKKMKACDRPPININFSSGNAIIEYSTLSFEKTRNLLNTFYCQSNYHTSISSKTDEEQNVVQETLTIHNATKKGKKGKYQYTVNFYLTTSKNMANGQNINKFLSADFPKIEELLIKTYNYEQEQALKRKLCGAIDALNDRDDGDLCHEVGNTHT